MTHVHGAHVDPHSDGYPEAWWLPEGAAGYVPKGSLFDDAPATVGKMPWEKGYKDTAFGTLDSHGTPA